MRKRHWYRTYPISILLSIPLAFSLITPSSLFATDFFVDNGGDDTNCNGLSAALPPGSPVGTCAFQTLQQSVTTSASGDTIHVAAGTYTEGVTQGVILDKTLTLLGAQAGLDARTRPDNPAAESIVNGANGAIDVRADSVIIDGFTFRDQTSGIFNGGSVLLERGFGGHQILNNIFRENIFGLYANSTTGTQTKIQFNLFRDNNNTGSASGNGVYADQGTVNTLVDSNTFLNNNNCGVTFDLFINSNSGITISNNLMDGNNGGACIFNATDVLIETNQITNSSSTGVAIGGNADQVAVQNNQITGSGVRAIGVRDLGPGPNSNITILTNQIIDNAAGIEIGMGGLSSGFEAHFNRIFNNANFGMQNSSGLLVNAENNWWGCNVGPNDAPGACDTASADIDFDPWLILRLLPDPASLFTNQTSNLLADLLQNSVGTDTSALGHIPDQTPVTFTANPGSVNPSSLGTTGGQATSVFTAAGNPGDAQVCTQVDNQPVCIIIPVKETAPPVPSPEFCLQGSGSLGRSGRADCDGWTCSLHPSGTVGFASGLFALVPLAGSLGYLFRIRRRRDLKEQIFFEDR